MARKQYVGSRKSWSQLAKESRLVSALPAIFIAVVIANLPVPDGLSYTSMRLLAVFAGVVMGLLTADYDMSVILAVALLVLTLTQSFMCTTADGRLVECDKCRTTYQDATGHWQEYKCDAIGGSFDVAVSGFSNKVAWLVFSAFHIGKAVEKTNFGRRVSLVLVKSMGRSTIGIAYAVCLAELALAPFIPSNTARGGGIVYPIVESVILALGVDPQMGENPVGGFLSIVASNANLLSSSLFVTGMAGNPIVASKAASIFGIDFGFAEWFLGASVPTLLLIFILPPIMHMVLRPKVDFTRLAREIRRQHHTLGPISVDELKLCGTLLLCLVLWVGTAYFGIDATVVAYMAIVVLILLDVLAWDDVVKNAKAWDTFFWLASFIVLAEQLTALGVTDWIGNSLSKSLHNASPLTSTVSLSMVYFFSMYMFSSISSHVVAFAGPFFAAGHVLSCPPRLLAIIIALFSSMAGVLTPFSTGSVAMYASQGYISQPRWFLLGLLSSLVILGVTFSVGLTWWKLLGWY
ncbi:Sodium/sulfate symporter [Martensiomyces pterosporus]|nr:Sodium/sulfate symporter [Martensiomyces pterosporus]